MLSALSLTLEDNLPEGLITCCMNGCCVDVSAPVIPSEADTNISETVESVKYASSPVPSDKDDAHFSKWELSWSSDVSDHNGKGKI